MVEKESARLKVKQARAGTYKKPASRWPYIVCISDELFWNGERRSAQRSALVPSTVRRQLEE